MIYLLAAHLCITALLSWAAAAGRHRRVGFEFFTLLLLPGIGAVTIALQILFEAIFTRSVRPTPASQLVEPDEELDRVIRDPVEEMRMGISVAPLAETLSLEDPATADMALQRLARAETPSALEKLKEALASGDRDVRVRARGLIVRVEDRLMRLIQTTTDPAERGRAYRKLACLSFDAVTAAQHLERAVEAFRRATAESSDPAVRLELGRLLLQGGSAAEAAKVFEEHIRKHPVDLQGHLGRAEANLRMKNLKGLRSDLGRLRLLDSRFDEPARSWIS